MTTAEAPKVFGSTEKLQKMKRKPRRGPPGVVCSSCHKLAGAEDEGRVDDLDVSVSGGTDSVEVSIDGASLILVSACCGMDFKRYDLSGNSKSQDHVCPKITERDDAAEAWREHCEDNDLQGVPYCATGCKLASDEEIAEVCCDTGGGLLERLLEIDEEIKSRDTDWTVDDQGDPEPYQRYQTHSRNRRTGKLTPIKRHRYAKSWRGFNLSVTVSHDLCGESETIEFGEGDAEAQSSSFEEA